MSRQEFPPETPDLYPPAHAAAQGFAPEGQFTRQDLRRAAWDEFRAIGDRARASRFKPDVYSVSSRLALGSQTTAERLLNTRRLDARLAMLVPQPVAPPKPTPAEMVSGDYQPAAEGSDEAVPVYNAPPQERAHVLAGDTLMLVASKLGASIECLNSGALIGRDELREIARDYGQDAMRFGLKFRSAVPIWMLELMRSGKGSPMQLAATALLVWSEVEDQPMSKDIQHGIASLNPVTVETLDDPQETVELVRLALTASNA